MELSQIFDPSLSHHPYGAAHEHLRDSLSVLDLHIACALQQVTLPLEDAWTHVSQRTLATLKLEETGCPLPLYEVIHRFDLDAFSYFCLLLALGPCVHDKYGHAYARLNESRKAPDLRLAQGLFSLGFPLEQETVFACLTPGHPCRILLGINGSKTPDQALDARLVLNAAAYGRIFDMPLSSPYFEQTVHIRKPMEDIFYPQAAPIEAPSTFVEQIAQGMFITAYGDPYAERHGKTVLFLGEKGETLKSALNKDMPDVSFHVIDPETALIDAEQAFRWGKDPHSLLEAAAQICSADILYLNWDLAAQFDRNARHMLLSSVVVEALLGPHLVCLSSTGPGLEEAVSLLTRQLPVLVILSP